MRNALDMCFALDMRFAREGAISYRIAQQYIEFAAGKYIGLCEAKHIDKSSKAYIHIEAAGDFATFCRQPGTAVRRKIRNVCFHYNPKFSLCQ